MTGSVCGPSGPDGPVERSVAVAHSHLNDVIWGSASQELLDEACDRVVEAASLADEHGYTPAEQGEIEVVSDQVCAAPDGGRDARLATHNALAGLEHYLVSGQGR